MIAIAILIVLGGCGMLWLISRLTPKGTIIGISAVIWAAGQFMADDSADRTASLIAGSLKILGTIGFILGIVELVIENKRRTKERQSKKRRKTKRRRRERRR